jgi:phage tail tape-measure protein
VFIGFGAGKAELKTLVEGYQVTATGLTPLGSAQIEAKGGKLPGFLVSAGIGAGVGGVVTSVVTSAVSSSVQETGETIEAAAQRTAKEIAKLIVDIYTKRGWL